MLLVRPSTVFRKLSIPDTIDNSSGSFQKLGLGDHHFKSGYGPQFIFIVHGTVQTKGKIIHGGCLLQLLLQWKADANSCPACAYRVRENKGLDSNGDFRDGAGAVQQFNVKK